MKQIYYPYWEWEDFQHEMYSGVNDEEMMAKIGLAKDLLKDVIEFESEARKMIFQWPKAAAHNLTNRSINRKAWIGQATCCFTHYVPEVLTRLAWAELTTLERQAANDVATKIIENYEAQNT